MFLMKLKILCAYLVIVNSIAYSQTIFEEFNSNRLGEKREIKIRLPNNYSNNDNITHPLVVVLDGDYLFEPVTGNIDYQVYWDEMPDCIVVGVNQEKSRLLDFEFSKETHMPSQNSAAFFEFISMELLPYISNKYSSSKFNIIVGHGLGANFLNYYLFKDTPLFDAYIALSPDFPTQMPNRLILRLSHLEKETYYYLATSDGDVSYLRPEILEVDGKLKNVPNPKLNYKFNDFIDSNHYTLVGQAIPEALNGIFKLYKPISKKEYKEQLLTYSGSTFEYLEEKYGKINESYGFEKQVVENDLRAIAAACQKREDTESLLKLAKLARKTYPKSMIGAYYYGIYYESTNDLKKALQSYHSGISLTPSQYVNKDILYEKIEEIKADKF